jgi:hypothetical protein
MNRIGLKRAALGVDAMLRSLLVKRVRLGLLATAGVFWASGPAWACPFCSAESRTLTEEIDLADVAVLAKLAGPDAADLDTGNAKFKVVHVLAGEDVLGDTKQFDAVFFGEPDTEQIFLISGIGIDYTEWSTPLPLSKAGVEYLERLPEVPESGADRLAFFQEFFENEEPLLAQDAYEEFARAPYQDVIALKGRMHHDRLVAWIKDPEINPSRRRLYLTMLGVCGSEKDLPMLEEMIVSGYDDKKHLIEPAIATGLALGGPLELPTWTEMVKLDERRKKLGLDALIGCYMVLRGPAGLDLIDRRLLNAPGADYSQVYSAIMALRFLAEETQIVPRERLLSSVRLLLDNPDFADQVIPDLARWEDWSVMDRLVEMFKKSDAKGYIRPPIVAYLLAAADQPGEVGARASAAMSDLEKIDADVVKRARSMMAFGFLARARTVDPAPGAARPEEDTLTDAASTQGFGASAADAAAENAADSAAPPDPAQFNREQAARTENAAGDQNSDVRIFTVPVGQPESSRETPAPDAATPATAVSASRTAEGNIEGSPAEAPLIADAKEIAQAPVPTALEDSPAANTLVVVGLPLAAVVLLVGVYWLILRSGAA